MVATKFLRFVALIAIVIHESHQFPIFDIPGLPEFGPDGFDITGILDGGLSGGLSELNPGGAGALAGDVTSGLSAYGGPNGPVGYILGQLAGNLGGGLTADSAGPIFDLFGGVSPSLFAGFGNEDGLIGGLAGMIVSAISGSLHKGPDGISANLDGTLGGGLNSGIFNEAAGINNFDPEMWIAQLQEIFDSFP